MANPQPRDDAEDPAATPRLDSLYSENELPAAGSVLEKQEIVSLLENWIDA